MFDHAGRSSRRHEEEEESTVGVQPPCCSKGENPRLHGVTLSSSIGTATSPLDRSKGEIKFRDQLELAGGQQPLRAFYGQHGARGECGS